MTDSTPLNGQETPQQAPKRKRTGRKRTRFQPPARPAPAVRELWGQASDEERARAHATCVEILEYWLGKKSKAEVAKELSVPALRVWQLSQQAVSGMLAGLLKQPRSRRKPAPAPGAPPSEDPRALRKRIAELEGKLSRTEDLVRVLRTAPWVQKPEARERMEHARKKTRRSRAKAPSRPRDPAANRSPTPQPPAQP